MSLLFDQNLSPRLPSLIAAEYPHALHLRSVGMAAATDQGVWEYAARNNLIIVSKDTDFQHRALLYGPPPKVIWLRIGNQPTAAVTALLKSRQPEVLSFEVDPLAALLVLP
jgi:predicted nuclease of predicted toxin-antitoxin system